MKKRAQVEDAFVNTIFYVGLLLVIILIVYGLLTGKAQAILQTILDKLRLF
ncbi:MAG TPA: hypothetical protein VKE88_03310 [Candidatus Nanoarchaeia archaeon]|nr:hypothetical protein [Candidatus Nanoarchaeia archaeon]